MNTPLKLTAALCTALLIAACQTEQKNTVETPVSLNDIQQTAANAPLSTDGAGRPAPSVLRQQAEMKMEAYERAKSSVHFAPSPSAKMYFPPVAQDRENYAHVENNPVKLASGQPVSTFSVDVDTASYANVRRMLNEGRLPPQDAVRIEEMINYFSYDYQGPNSRNQPFRVTAEMAPSPWNPQKHLLHIGIKGFAMDKSQLPPSNLVFLVDVSGSMQSADKLPLLKEALKALTHQLSGHDRVSLVVYAGASGVVLEPTAGNNHARIAAALDHLYAGGSTNGADGIRLAYQLAASAFIEGGINRVILCTDGDFNVGTVNFETLIDLVEQKRKTGISLTTLGFGTGNYNDRLMEQLADKGNGNYAYIDTGNEAHKVLVQEIGSTLMTIAKDVKIQIEFNPNVVSEYRLIGYENRMLKREDFNNDQVDAGDIGAGHTVTALYEVTLSGSKGLIDPLRYAKPVSAKGASRSEIAFLRLRYKQPDSDQSQLLEYPLHRKMIKSFGKTSERFRFAASVAAFGDLLRGGTYSNGYSYDDVAKLARRSRGNDAFGYRAEFVHLVQLAKRLDSRQVRSMPLRPYDDGLIVE